ncbi:Ig-like domain-containing protein [Luteolibacter yonseiensis]|uniref:Ig-like domain-containing protein n=1 Tax=Luteolibacter yonseiensis TaxID=1144680 RepID=A0A934R0D5_9BACT|nr:Ig-like domain-containing protein [Luteolibacter yonseiensis]MBK1814006.1 Ig-like domain-containing protein [Luteolibacter yonseiensis]
MPEKTIIPPLAGKRRTLGWLSGVLTALSTLSAPALHAANPTKLGDVDGDGQLTVYDLTRLRGHIRQTSPLAADLVPFADVTGDGFINEDDSVSLINTITGADTVKTLPLSSIRESSPFSGESNVSLTREVVVRFTTPLALNATLSTWNANTQTPGTLYAEGGGRKLLTRVELGGDHTKATLFFLEPVPASTRITVTFNDTGLRDLLGRQIDPDGDGTAGGAVVFTYDTSPITPVPGTGVIGHVYASEKAPGGADVPLAGALVRVVGSETLFTHTAADGSFSLKPCPAGRFFVEVDGRTCPVSNFPDGGYYPYINKPWEALPGKADNLAAGTGIIYLPLVPANTLKPVSASAETTVTFAPSAVAANPALAGVEIYVPPNSLFADDGTRGGKVGLAPVASDRLPEPLPPGLNHALDISIQTDGGTNFDQPVPVKFPNLPDPVTGIKLKPGEKSALWSYNHDKGRWEISGPMTVTADGNFLVTDVGVGVRQPGWHGAMPGIQPNPNTPGVPEKPDPCDIKPPDSDNNYFRQQLLCLRDTLCEQYKNLPPDQHVPFPKWQIDRIANDGFRSIRSCTLWENINNKYVHLNCFNILGQWHVDHELVPAFEEYAEMLAKEPNSDDLFQQWRQEHNAFLNGTLTDCLNKVLPGPSWGIAPDIVGKAARDAREDAIRRAKEAIAPPIAPSPLQAAASNVPLLPTISPQIDELSKIKVRVPAGFVRVGERVQLQAWKNVGGSVVDLPSQTAGTYFFGDRDSTYYTIDAGGWLTVHSTPAPFVRYPRIVYPLVVNGEEYGFGQIIIVDEDKDGDGLADSYEKRIGLSPDKQNTKQTDTDGDGLNDILEVALGLSPTNPDTDGDGFTDGNENQVGSSPVNRHFPVISTVDGTFHYLIEDLTNGSVRRGKMSLNKGTSFPILPTGAAIRFTILSLDLTRFSRVHFNTPDVSTAFDLPTPLLTDLLGTDSDSDGLPDIAEEVLGTNPHDADSDHDGVNDKSEVLQDSNPLDGAAVSTGLFATIDTPGQARDIAAQNNIAIVADGSEGVSLFDVSTALNPVRTAQVRLNGSIEAVALDGTLAAAVGANLNLLDLANLSAVRLIKELSLGGSPTCVTTAGKTAYAGLGTGQVVAVDMAAGVEIERIQVANEGITDVTFVGDVLYARTASRVFAIDLAGGGMALAESVPVNGSAGGGWRLRLNPGNGQLYAPNLQGYTIISLANPLAPAVQEVVSTQQFGWKQMVPTGSGLGVAAMSGFGADADISLYNIGADGRGTRFLTTFVTPGTTEAVSIYNGLAYVADGNAGLTIVNYKAYDTLRVPPGIDIKTGFPVVNGSLQAEEGKLGRVSATVIDDVQVRDVEFYVDGQRITTDGNFPFEHRFTTPLRSQAAAATAAATAALDKLNSPCCGDLRATNEAAALVEKAQAAAELPLKTSFTLRARATDTGGNSTWSETLTVNLVADATAPRVVKLLPADGSLTGKLRTFGAVFSEPLNQATISPATLVLTAAGPDGLFGTADDITPTGGVLSYRDSSNSVFLTFPADLSSGMYQFVVRPPLADLAGNPIASEKTAKVRVFGFSDRDGDGVPDDVEALLGLDPDKPDSDGDGIPDGQEDYDNDGLINTAEIYIGTDPTNADTNGNGIRDSLEDPDGDKLNNADEFTAGTDPNKADTDSDGWNDETEVTGGSNPLDPNSRPFGFIASLPPVNILAIGDAANGLLGKGSVIARPPVHLTRMGSDPANPGGSGNASFIATPPVHLARLASSQGGAGAASIISRPATFISRLSTIGGTDGSTGGASIIARPPVNVTRIGSAGAILSKPPVTIQIDPP